VNRVRIAAIGVLAMLALGALLAPVWARDSYQIQFREAPDSPPSWKFPLGTDALGRDRLTRLGYGARVSFLLAPAAALLTCLEAAVLGGLAGFAGRRVRSVVLFAADLFLTLPWLFLLIAVRACLPLNTSPEISVAITFLLLGALGWAAPARIICAAVRKLNRSDFILQARAAGCSPARLLLRHLIPNVMPVLLAQFWIAVPVYILAEATLGMLGLGVSEPLPSLGSILRDLEGVDVIAQPWQLAPAIVLAVFAGAFQLVRPREDYSL